MHFRKIKLDMIDYKGNSKYLIIYRSGNKMVIILHYIKRDIRCFGRL